MDTLLENQARSDSGFKPKPLSKKEEENPVGSAFTFAVHPGLTSTSSDRNFAKESVHYSLRKNHLDRDIQKLVRHGCSHGTTGAASNTQILVNTPTTNPFVSACTLAFDKHLPLTLRPQFFWLCITQAVALHVEANAEALRENFVSHEGKMVLKLNVTAAACAGFQQHHWEAVVGGFDVLLREKTKDGVVDLLGCSEFSNTTLAEDVAGKMTCMDVLKSYFEYKCCTCCGFPSVTMEGTVEDWRLLRVKAEKLVKTSTLPKFADGWLPALTDILDRLVATREGKEVDVQFWESFVKRGATHGSGAHSWVSGWINVFFPLQSAKRPNRFCVKFEGGDQYNQYVGRGGRIPKQMGLDTDDFPSGLSSAPVTLDEHPLEFRSGFVGVEQDPESGGVMPTVGWLVASGACPRSGRYNNPDIPQATKIITAIGVEIPLLDFVKDPQSSPSYY